LNLVIRNAFADGNSGDVCRLYGDNSLWQWVINLNTVSVVWDWVGLDVTMMRDSWWREQWTGTTYYRERCRCDSRKKLSGCARDSLFLLSAFLSRRERCAVVWRVASKIKSWRNSILNAWNFVTQHNFSKFYIKIRLPLQVSLSCGKVLYINCIVSSSMLKPSPSFLQYIFGLFTFIFWHVIVSGRGVCLLSNICWRSLKLTPYWVIWGDPLLTR
jgi:hypothetical protein